MPAKADIDLDLSAIKAELALTLDDINADVGLDDIQISIPKPVVLDLGLDDIKATVDLNTSVHVGGELSTKSAVQADIGATANLDAKAHLGIDEIRARLGADANVVAALRELAPVFLNLLWKEVPFVRVGMPHRYKLGLRLFGIEVASLSFCGESEIVTEDNRAAGGGAP